jgi:hypothetical protein
MKLEELRTKIGHRALLNVSGTFNQSRYGPIEEYKILEISPSGEWVKLLNQNGNRFWKRCNEVALLEFLSELEPRPPI